MVPSICNIKYEIRELGKKNDSMDTTVADITENVHSGSLSNNVATYSADYCVYNFPLTSIEELTTFEEKLSDNTFKNKVVNYKYIFD